jgi:hypothetical protein
MTINIDEIFTAWLKTASHTDEEKEIAEERLSICNQCPNKVKGLGSLYICGDCKCPIAFGDKPIGKCYSEHNNCPLSYWKR